MTTPVTQSQVKRLIELSEKATPGPWIDDSFNTVFDSQRREMFSIPDHPDGGDEYYEPEQISERSTWYRESEDNKWFLLAARNEAPDIARALEQAMHYLAEGHEKLHGHMDDRDNCQVRDFLRSYFDKTEAKDGK